MVSAISFTGTYKVNNQDKNSFSLFQKYALDKEHENGAATRFKDKFVPNNSGSFDYMAEQILIVPDYMDVDVETFCKNNGISYKKYDTKDLLNPQAIKSRIAFAPKGYRQVYVDTKKLDELTKNQNSNIEHCKSDYNQCFREKVGIMFRNGEKIPATTLYIYNPSGNDDLRHYVKRFDVNHMNDKQIFVDFVQKTDDPDHCTYFALKEMGMDKIPVYVDNQSYEAGNILGLFS